MAMLVDYIECMKPIVDGLDCIQRQHATLGYVLPTLYALKHKLIQAELGTTAGSTMRDCLLVAIDERFSTIMKLTPENKQLILASVTHPKFKLRWVPRADLDLVRNLFIDNYCAEHLLNSEGVVSSESSANEEDFFGNYMKNSRDN